MELKYIKLFEDYEKELKAENSETGHTWGEVRDAIQMKRPFVIIIFTDKPSYNDALNGVLSEYDYVKQTASLVFDGKFVDYPSVFFTLNEDKDFKNSVKELYDKYKIKQIIVGKSNTEFATLYSEDGTSSDFGNEVTSTLVRDDFGRDDHFKVGSMYYKFISFIG